ncbi:MAG: dTDP-4-dehydrorhamnose 3,5-epimerase family protein [Candidatus Bathyarchaeota archaeon]|nr:dTDP-4-dehydrorhamnose 3,5-epimerase family protein [Candidatus Bathyarchaeota archaeon]
MLQGIKVKPLKIFADERGFFTEIFKSKMKEIFSDQIVQANLSITYPGIIRAWHRHERGQIDYFVVVKGAAKICAYKEESKELNEVISTGKEIQIVRVPGLYWHGFKALGNEPSIIIYFVNKLYDPKDPDEVRRDWKDPEIVPKKINDKKDDPRCNKPWDWVASPNK